MTDKAQLRRHFTGRQLRAAAKRARQRIFNRHADDIRASARFGAFSGMLGGLVWTATTGLLGLCVYVWVVGEFFGGQHWLQTVISGLLTTLPFALAFGALIGWRISVAAVRNALGGSTDVFHAIRRSMTLYSLIIVIVLVGTAVTTEVVFGINLAAKMGFQVSQDTRDDLSVGWTAFLVSGGQSNSLLDFLYTSLFYLIISALFAVPVLLVVGLISKTIDPMLAYLGTASSAGWVVWLWGLLTCLAWLLVIALAVWTIAPGWFGGSEWMMFWFVIGPGFAATVSFAAFIIAIALAQNRRHGLIGSTPVTGRTAWNRASRGAFVVGLVGSAFWFHWLFGIHDTVPLWPSRHVAESRACGHELRVPVTLEAHRPDTDYLHIDYGNWSGERAPAAMELNIDRALASRIRFEGSQIAESGTILAPPHVPSIRVVASNIDSLDLAGPGFRSGAGDLVLTHRCVLEESELGGLAAGNWQLVNIVLEPVSERARAGALAWEQVLTGQFNLRGSGEQRYGLVVVPTDQQLSGISGLVGEAQLRFVEPGQDAPDDQDPWIDRDLRWLQYNDDALVFADIDWHMEELSQHVLLPIGTDGSWRLSLRLNQLDHDGWTGLAIPSGDTAIRTTPVSVMAFMRLVALGEAGADLANAIPVDGEKGSDVRHNLISSAKDGEPEQAGGRQIWWTWTAPGDGIMTIDASRSSFFFAEPRVYDETDGQPEAETPMRFGPDNYAISTFGARAGRTYLISIGDEYADAGQVKLTWSFEDRPFGPAGTDEVSDAPELTGPSGTARAYNTAASAEDGEWGLFPEFGGKSIWWRWTSPIDGFATITTAGSSFDTTMAVFTMSTPPGPDESINLSQLELLASDDDSGGGTDSRINFSSRAGKTYFIVVDGYDGSVGDAYLNWSLTEASLVAASGDMLADAVPLDGLAGSVDGENFDASKEPLEPDHGNPGGRSIWWRWTAPEDAEMTVGTHGSDFDTVLGVYRARLPIPEGHESFADLEMLGTDDDSGGNRDSEVQFQARRGERYFFAVDGFEGLTGVVRLNWGPLGDFPSSSVGDMLADAIPLVGVNGNEYGRNSGATKEPSEPNHGDRAAGRSIWWRWTAPSDGELVIDATDSSLETILAIYKATVPAPPEGPPGFDTLVREGIDDSPDGQETSAAIRVPVQKDTLYFIAVDSTEESWGEIYLNWSFTLPHGADRLDEALVLEGDVGRHVVSNANATTEPGEPEHAFMGGKSVWWKWRAPSNGELTLDTAGSTFDSSLAAYRRMDSPADDSAPDFADLGLVASDDDGGLDLNSLVKIVAVAGETYFIAVDGYNGESGDVGLAWKFTRSAAN